MAVGLMGALAGCGLEVGSGRYAEEVRETAAFKALELSNGLAAEVTVGAGPEVVVTGDDNLLAEVHTDVRGDTLFVEIPEHFGWSSNLGLVVKIVVPELEKVQVSGGGRLEVAGIDAASFTCIASGGSDVTLIGGAAEFSVEASGGSQLRAAGFATDKADVTLSGGSGARVQISSELGATLSGGSRLTVIGHPSIVRSELSGGSQVLTE